MCNYWKVVSLNCCFPSCRKIEGLEQMVNLQILNLANNSIEQVPLWVGKKLRSLQKLNLQKNKIFSVSLTLFCRSCLSVIRACHDITFILFYLLASWARQIEASKKSNWADVSREPCLWPSPLPPLRSLPPEITGRSGWAANQRAGERKSRSALSHWYIVTSTCCLYISSQNRFLLGLQDKGKIWYLRKVNIAFAQLEGINSD